MKRTRNLRTGRMLVMGGLGVLLIGGICASVILFSTSRSVAVAQIQREEAASAEMVPWVGEFGITETVAEIMARDQVVPPFPTEAEVEHERRDRSNLPQDPDSPATSQWPPALDDLTPQPADEAQVQRGGGGPNLPQTLGTSFLGATSSESGYVPPDTMGAVGPTQVMIWINGRIKVFSKTGVPGPLDTTGDSFFNSVRGGSAVVDPRCTYDRITSRWFVIGITVSTPNRIVIAVSSGPTITGSGSFTFFYFQQDTVTPTGSTDTGGLLDYPSLGVDANAVYIAGNMFNSNYRGTTGFVVRKSSVTGGGPIVVTAFRQMCTSTGAGPYTPMGVDNDDPAATEGYFIGVDNQTNGRLVVRRISNPGGAPTISGNINITTPTTGNPMSVTVLGSSGDPLDAIDDRLMGAKIHKNQFTGVRTLWTAHHFEVNASGVASSSGNRNGVRWYQIGSMTATPTLIQSGTLFDSASSNPNSYWMGHAVMSGQGHMAVASTVGGLARRAEIAGAGRLDGDALGSTQAATTLQTSSTNYNAQSGTQRWGDYSHSMVDPADDMTIWTFQEYCNATDSYGVRAIELKAPPPATPASCVPASVNRGQSNVNVVVTGTSSAGSGFFNPDASFPNHIAGSVGGTGVTVNSVTVSTPTQLTLNVSVSGGAATGARTITITNPDGQFATSATGILTISAGWQPGDMNCDGLVNNQDIDAFVLALFDPAGYAAAYPGCDIHNGDFTGEGAVNNQDIDGFIAALFG